MRSRIFCWKLRLIFVHLSQSTSAWQTRSLPSRKLAANHRSYFLYVNGDGFVPPFECDSVNSHRKYYRVRFGCECCTISLGGEMLIAVRCSWGKNFGHSWRVNILLGFPRAPIFYWLLGHRRYRARVELIGGYHQLVCTHLHRVKFPMLMGPSFDSNSFITQGTDFSGHNDMDMVLFYLLNPGSSDRSW